MWIIILTPPLFLLLIIIEMIVDRIQHGKSYRLNELFANINCGIGHTILSQFAYIFGVGLYILVYSKWRIVTIPVNWYWGIVLFFAIDLLYYLAHFSFHKVNFLWVDHSVHHLGEDYNLSISLRLGFYQIFYAFVYYLPLALLGFKPELFLILVSLQTFYQFINHTDKIGKLGFIEKVLITPSHHRVHHGRNPQYIDKNFGGVFIIWDRMFGTFQLEEEKVIYGITTPVKSFNPLYMQVHYLKLLVQDFARVKGGVNKIKLLFKKPGWLDKESGGMRVISPVDIESYVKHDIQLRQGLNYYLLFQCILVMAGTLFFLSNFQTLGVWIKIEMAILIYAGIFSIGVILDKSRYALLVECIRLTLTLFFILFLIFTMHSGLGYLVSCLLLLISLFVSFKLLSA